jgi:hypothetical protein
MVDTNSPWQQIKAALLLCSYSKKFDFDEIFQEKQLSLGAFFRENRSDTLIIVDLSF